MFILQDDALLALFCSVDDFCKDFLPRLNACLLPDPKRRNRTRSLSESEIMTLLIAFHQNQFRNFKAFYRGFVCLYWQKAFPRLVSYNRFVEYISSAIVPLCAYLHSLFGKCTGITFADSTTLVVCKNPRIEQHRVFADVAKRGKTSTGWFFGFKLHSPKAEGFDTVGLAPLPFGNVCDAFRRRSLVALRQILRGLPRQSVICLSMTAGNS